jgi:hypothetical protein
MGRQVLLTIPKLAAAYQLPESTLYRLAWSGELPGAVKLNNRWYVRAPTWEAWLRGEEQAPGRPPGAA